MPVTDDQLETLEAYIDGELPAEQEEALSRRLENEPELAAALDALRAERDVRAQVWRACEPDETTVQRLVMKIESAVDREAVWAYRLAKWRIPSAAAACILLGFLFGWVGRGTSPVNGGEPGQANLVAEATNPANPILPSPGMPSAAPINVSIPANPGLANVKASGPVELPLVDEYGHVVAVQRFKSAEDAARFVEDLSNWQKTQEKVKGGNIVPTGAEKF